MTPAALARTVADRMLRDDRATNALGIQIDSVGVGASQLSMTVREEMLNGFGNCHGGLIFALADSAFGLACNSRNQRAVAASCQIDYLLPVRLGDRLRATAVERVAGSRLGLYDVTITNQQDEVVALFRGRSCTVRGTVIDLNEQSQHEPLLKDKQRAGTNQ